MDQTFQFTDQNRTHTYTSLIYRILTLYDHTIRLPAFWRLLLSISLFLSMYEQCHYAIVWKRRNRTRTFILRLLYYRGFISDKNRCCSIDKYIFTHWQCVALPSVIDFIEYQRKSRLILMIDWKNEWMRKCARHIYIYEYILKLKKEIMMHKKKES
jgi:hypothetical protein